MLILALLVSFNMPRLSYDGINSVILQFLGTWFALHFSTVEVTEELFSFADILVCIKVAYKYLVHKGKVPGDAQSFKKLLYEKWFDLYRRGRGGCVNKFKYLLMFEYNLLTEMCWYINMRFS